mgnify:CR=1 FL=1
MDERIWSYVDGRDWEWDEEREAFTGRSRAVSEEEIQARRERGEAAGRKMGWNGEYGQEFGVIRDSNSA